MSNPTLNFQASKVKVPPSPNQLRFFRRSSAVIVVFVALTALADLWMRRLTVYGSTEVLGYDLLFSMTALGSVVAMIVIWTYRIYTFAEPSQRRLTSALWPIAPLFIFAVVFLLNWNEVPFHVAFSLSRPALERAAMDFKSNPSKGVPQRYIGLFPVDTIRIEGDCVIFHVVGSDGFDTSAGLEWSPDLAPSNVYHTESLGNGWYHQLY